MEATLEEKIMAIFNTSRSFKIEKVNRRKDGEDTLRYLWNIDGVQCRDWLGFDSLDECIDDCLTYLTINSFYNI